MPNTLKLTQKASVCVRQIYSFKIPEKIKKYIDRMLVILPFEEDFYKKYNYKVSFVGHPLLDAIDNFRLNADKDFANKNKLFTLHC